MAGAAAPCALTVTITSAERVHELNREYAGLDEPTDVLSFGPEGEPYAVEPGEPPYLGDVVIAYPVAEQQAADNGLPVLIEAQTLAVHGVLHLLGYDHDTPDRRAEMWALQSAAMDAVRAASK
jgi:probable rRNA maturation factor